jgi:hypothetical protein
MVRRWVWSRKILNEEAMAHWGAVAPKTKLSVIELRSEVRFWILGSSTFYNITHVTNVSEKFGASIIRLNRFLRLASSCWITRRTTFDHSAWISVLHYIWKICNCLCRGSATFAWHKIQTGSVCGVWKMGNNMAHVPKFDHPSHHSLFHSLPLITVCFQRM